MLRRADSLGAKLCAILGEDEVARGVVTVKDLAGHSQDSIALDTAARLLADRVRGSDGGSR
jgi:histidyl-tRNA synthetase